MENVWNQVKSGIDRVPSCRLCRALVGASVTHLRWSRLWSQISHRFCHSAISLIFVAGDRMFMLWQSVLNMPPLLSSWSPCQHSGIIIDNQIHKKCINCSPLLMNCLCICLLILVGDIVTVNCLLVIWHIITFHELISSKEMGQNSVSGYPCLLPPAAGCYWHQSWLLTECHSLTAAVWRKPQKTI